MKFKTTLIIAVLSICTSIVYFSNVENFRGLASVSTRTFPDYFPDSIYFSLNDKHEAIEGPIERRDDEGRYMKRVFGLLIQAADKLAKKDWYYPNDNVYQTYNTFLLTAAMVPYHESRYVHLRQRDSEQCSVKTNGVVAHKTKEEAITAIKAEKDLLQKEVDSYRYDLNFVNEEYKKKMSREDNRRNRAEAARLNSLIKAKDKSIKELNKLITGGSNALWSASSKFKGLINRSDIFVPCDSAGEFKQLLFSYDYNDVGIMMFNMKANPGPFERGSILSTNLIISEGVSLLYKSFNRNASDYKTNKYLSCFQGKNGLNHLNLVRGTWSNYNGGHFDQRACRFIGSMSCLKHIYNNYTSAVGKMSSGSASAEDKKIYNEYNYTFQSNDKALIKLITEYETNSLDANIDLNSFACRFKENDWHFFNNLVSFFYNENSYMHKFLPESSIERKALDELITNVKNKTNKRQYLDQVLVTNYQDYLDEKYEEGQALTPDNNSDENNSEENEIRPEVIAKHDPEPEVNDVVNEAPIVQEYEPEATIVVDEEGALPAKSEESKVYILKGRNINLRYSPEIVSYNRCGNTSDLGGKVVTVEIVDKEVINGFYKVHSDLFNELSSADCAKDSVAYVWADFVVEKESTKAEEKVEENLQYGTISSGVKIRTTYKRGAWTGRVLSRGDRVVVIEKVVWGDPWYHIVTEDGFEGWVWQNVALE
ncbi:hypothetical protein M899_1698 [Bacteriovorax sp. BSW11_IV]|uniref:SH3 domain-containing protein n=1 Tax=Bacteriovorax sp. BSW11_IV TaxID=1353529 RepID=UPI00038A1B10|nr:SH3 domain-containing protein [Bacteriovorax sp. BSW11_IV]EQC49406.1 hypothetical protein M899_1698 [Bacteriovorax sp. BSW11_IV]